MHCASQPVSHIGLATLAKSSAEFPNKGWFLRIFYIYAPEGCQHGTHIWDGLHTRHLLTVYPWKLVITFFFCFFSSFFLGKSDTKDVVVRTLLDGWIILHYPYAPTRASPSGRPRVGSAPDWRVCSILTGSIPNMCLLPPCSWRCQIAISP